MQHAHVHVCCVVQVVTKYWQWRSNERLPGAPAGRSEIWGDMGRYGEIWGDMGRHGEIWGDMGRYAHQRVGRSEARRGRCRGANGGRDGNLFTARPVRRRSQRVGWAAVRGGHNGEVVRSSGRRRARLVNHSFLRAASHWQRTVCTPCHQFTHPCCEALANGSLDRVRAWSLVTPSGASQRAAGWRARPS